MHCKCEVPMTQSSTERHEWGYEQHCKSSSGSSMVSPKFSSSNTGYILGGSKAGNRFVYH